MLKSSRDIKRRLEQDGWVIERIRAPTISFAIH